MVLTAASVSVSQIKKKHRNAFAYHIACTALGVSRDFNATIAEGGKLTTTCDNTTQYVAAIHAFETKAFVVLG